MLPGSVATMTPRSCVAQQKSSKIYLIKKIALKRIIITKICKPSRPQGEKEKMITFMLTKNKKVNKNSTLKNKNTNWEKSSGNF